MWADAGLGLRIIGCRFECKGVQGEQDPVYCLEVEGFKPED